MVRKNSRVSRMPCSRLLAWRKPASSSFWTEARECFTSPGRSSRWVIGDADPANPTVLTAGYKHNVIPGTASALLDCRFLPGHTADELRATIRELKNELDAQVKQLQEAAKKKPQSTAAPKKTNGQKKK